MSCEPSSFYEAVIAAGAITTGFCGTFLSFRIQREAGYFRQPALSFEQKEAHDVFIGLTHFTSAFFLLILATICSTVFGFVFPLLALIGTFCDLASPRVIAGGLIATMVLLASYFLDELLHYKIISNGLVEDTREWGRELFVVVGGIVIALVLYFVTAGIP